MLAALPKFIMHTLAALAAATLAAQPAPTPESVSTLISAGRMQEARQALKQLDASLPQTAHLSGVVNFNLRDYKQAIADFERALRGEAKDGAAYRESAQLLGRSLYLTGRSADALPWLEHAWQLGGRGSEVLYMLGNSYIDGRNANGARFAFADLYGVGRDTPPAYLLTARMMSRRNARELAARQLDLALVGDPRLPGAHQLAAELAAARQDYATAVTQAKQELEIQPDYAASHLLVGEMMLRGGQLDASIDALRRAAWLNPYQMTPYLLLGEAYLQKGDYGNAEGVLKRAAQGDPGNAACLDLLVKALKAGGKAEEAKAVEQRAAELRR